MKADEILSDFSKGMIIRFFYRRKPSLPYAGTATRRFSTLLHFFQLSPSGCHFIRSFLHTLAREGDNSVLKKGADTALFYFFRVRLLCMQFSPCFSVGGRLICVARGYRRESFGFGKPLCKKLPSMDGLFYFFTWQSYLTLWLVRLWQKIPEYSVMVNFIPEHSGICLYLFYRIKPVTKQIILSVEHQHFSAIS